MVRIGDRASYRGEGGGGILSIRLYNEKRQGGGDKKSKMDKKEGSLVEGKNTVAESWAAFATF